MTSNRYQPKYLKIKILINSNQNQNQQTKIIIIPNEFIDFFYLNRIKLIFYYHE